MDKGTFASYKFKASDVIEGLNRYFAETKANRYRRVSLEIRRGVCYNNPDCVKDIVFTNSPPDWRTRSGRVCWGYYLICDPEEAVGVAINWLREEYDIFYTPGMETPVESFDVDEAAKEYEKATRKDIFCEMYHNAIEERNKFGRRLMDIRQASGMADVDPTDLVEYVKTLREKTEENGVLRGDLDYFADLAQKRQMELSNLRYDILKVYREIFDCSNGDPEGSDEETMQDILTEYQRVLKLKDVAEEKAIKYKELARENEEQAAKYKDTANLRKAIWEAMDRKPETLPEETARLVGEVRMLAECEKHIREFRDAVAEAIGITYPTTNNFILKRVSDIYKDRGEAHDLAMELDRKCIDLTAKNSDLQQKFEFQSGLRQQWHARYESEHERANGVQKALDREREKCRVKDISLETAKKQYEKVCGNLETAECAINGMKSKIWSLREEKTKGITALGQDVWDDCLK